MAGNGRATDGIAAEILWQDRVAELRDEFNRIKYLLDGVLVRQMPGLAGCFRQTLSELQSCIEDLEGDRVGGDVGERWKRQAGASRKCQIVAALQLELLAGVELRSHGANEDHGFDGSFVARSEIWLHGLHQRLNVKAEPVVIPGRRPLLQLESELGRDVVRVPFPDWDLWHLPLLGQAAGLLAVDEDSRGIFSQVIGQLLSEAETMPHRAPASPSQGHLASAPLRLLCADMFATAALGPVYALALVVLELDYGGPAQGGLGYQDEANAADPWPVLPNPSERAAAVLHTLERMDQALPRHPFQAILAKLTDLCEALFASSGNAELLATTRQRCRACHARIFDDAIRKLVSADFEKVERSWNRAQDWFRHFSDGNAPPPIVPPENQEFEFPLELASAIWLHRITYSAHADDVYRMARRVLAGGHAATPYNGSKMASFPQTVAEVRLERLEKRWRAFMNLLQDDGWVSAADRSAVTGRFYRLLSQQVYALDEFRQALNRGGVSAEAWKNLAELEGRASSVQREALEFLGGLLVTYRKLDRQSAKLINQGEKEDGPSVTALAGLLLQDCGRRSGVNWDGLIIPGRDPFLAPETGLIRLHFPDLSLWNLPLMAHEFGHIVAHEMAEFRRYQITEARAAVSGPAEVATEANPELIFSHLDEFFADLFAVYTVGPAFACAAAMLRFNPHEAYWERGAHPTHQERVQVILQALGGMGAYDPIPQRLQSAWDMAVQASGAVPTESLASDRARRRLERAKRWGRELYTLIDQSFRLGGRYPPERWECAKMLAQRLAEPPSLSLAELESGAGCGRISLDDLLNLLWWARVALASRPHGLGRLNLAAYRLGRDILQR